MGQRDWRQVIIIFIDIDVGIVGDGKIFKNLLMKIFVNIPRKVCKKEHKRNDKWDTTKVTLLAPSPVQHTSIFLTHSPDLQKLSRSSMKMILEKCTIFFGGVWWMDYMSYHTQGLNLGIDSWDSLPSFLGFRKLIYYIIMYYNTF